METGIEQNKLTIAKMQVEVLRGQLADAQRALDAEREKMKELEQEGLQLFEWRLALHSLTPGGSEFCTPEACESWVRKSRASQHEYIIEQIKQRKELQAQLATLQAQLARWKEALGEWLWNCTNLLGDYNIKTVQDFNEEVNRRIAWLMQHLDYTLPPPMTDEERDRMRKLSEDNAALQAQLAAEQQRADRAVKDRSDVLDVKTKEGLSCSEWLMRTAIAERKVKGLQAQLRQAEGERDEARHRVDELESREIDVEILQGDLDTLRQWGEALQREVEELTAANYYRLAAQMGLVVMCRVQIEEQPTEESLC